MYVCVCVKEMYMLNVACVDEEKKVVCVWIERESLLIRNSLCSFKRQKVELKYTNLTTRCLIHLAVLIEETDFRLELFD